ncbi:MAG: hypothetical protein PHR44_08030 [Candidatus Omnitrophica bacterium]|nr:hypothetical protein [Candidatus Omnitrophota bacterium]
MDNGKRKKKIVLASALALFLCLSQRGFTADAGRAQLLDGIDELRGVYFGLNQYNEFVDFLKSMLPEAKESEKAAVAYFIALTRFTQFGFLETNKMWDEYFNKGDDFRKEFTENLQFAIEHISRSDILLPEALFLKWKFLKREGGAEDNTILEELFSALKHYSQQTKDIESIRGMADRLKQEGADASARSVYALYARKVDSTVKSPDEIKEKALQALEEGSVELAQALFDSFIERIRPQQKEDAAGELSGIVERFSCEGENFDVEYSEKVFAMLNEISAGSPGEDLLYLRAKNLQHAGLLVPAAVEFEKLLYNFPKGRHLDEAEFKLGIINLYVVGNQGRGRELLSGIIARPAAGAYYPLSLYHLGLICQWNNDHKCALDHYGKILSMDEEMSSDIKDEAGLRISEINNGSSIEHNLKTFLDACLRQETGQAAIPILDLKASPIPIPKNKEVDFSVPAFISSAGCFPQKTGYLWSGQIPGEKPLSDSPEFSVTYGQAGTKVVNIVAVNPSGAASRAIAIIDVQ